MKTPAQADLQRWSDEVARDPRSLAFLPLARAYRKQGLREAALELCLRGLEAYPQHVEAHSLLALLYLERGDHEKAADEWSTVLRFDPDNFEALRGMGFWCFERDQLSRARQLLERAALQRPNDATVNDALHELGTRHELHEGARSTATFLLDDQWVPATPAAKQSAAPAPVQQDTTPVWFPPEEDTDDSPADAPVLEISRLESAHIAAPAPVAAVAPPPAYAPLHTIDPAAWFDDLLAAGPLLGALLVDAQGLVLAGRLARGVGGDAATLGAVLGAAVIEAVRTTAHLGLGQWHGLLLDAEQAQLHLKPVRGDNSLVLAARRDAPAGWLLRVSTQAAERAAQYLEEYA